MGAWGHQPKDNDGAWDIADTALAKAEAWLAKEYARRPGYGKTAALQMADARFVRAGAVQILLERGVFVRRSLVEQAVADLDAVLADDGYLKGWRNPRLARHGTARIHAAMRALLKQGYWRKGRVYSPRPVPGAKFLPSSRILAPTGWPAKDAGKRSWTGFELLGAVRVKRRRRRRWTPKPGGGT